MDHRKKVREFMARPPFGRRDLTEAQLDLFCTALTHDSYSNEHSVPSFERLEFLGDAVIELIVCEHIYTSTGDGEGNMTVMKQGIVSNRAISSAILEKGVDIDGVMLVGRGHTDRAGRNIPGEGMRADSFEALAGAFYLIYGLEECRRMVLSVLL